MNRRDALSRVSLLFGGGVLIGSDAFLSGCSRREEKAMNGMAFTDHQVSFLNEVGETILPATAESPGAKEARVGEFMNTIVTDCYTAEDQRIILEGIGIIEQRSGTEYKREFLKLKDAEKLSLLNAIDKEAKNQKYPHYFTMMKQLTVWGYFTSEVGSTKALRYVPVPGRYEGCIPYTKGEGVFADI
jgi:hypothetical protein